MNGVVVAFLGGFHILAAAAFAFPFELRYAPIMAGMYLWMGFATTFYLHRCLTHRAFETTAAIKAFFFLGSAIGQQGDPATWVGMHRHHHGIADQDDDVNGPRVGGFWHSHVGWLFQLDEQKAAVASALAPDVVASQPFLRHFATPGRYLLPHLVAAGLLGWGLGLGGLLWCLYVPMVAVYHLTWCVNSFCHAVGYRNFDTPDASTNFWPLGVLGLGEGWHNNHHHFPGGARAGARWWELDATAGLIRLLERLGLAWDVRWAQPSLD